MFAAINTFVGNGTSKELLFHRPCPLCCARDSYPIFQYTDFQFYSDSADLPKRIDIPTVQCRQCLCVYMNPAYSTYGFNILFAEAGMSYVSADAGGRGDIPRWLAESGTLAGKKNVLDIGCFDGTFLASLPSSLNRIGMDIDLPAIERGKKRYPELTLLRSSFESFTCQEPIDLITMFHVLEHLVSPLAVLQRLYEVSTDDATLVLEVPVMELSVSNNIIGMFSQQHLTHFSIHTLRTMLGTAGWKITSSVSFEYGGYRVVAVKTSPASHQEPNFDDLLLAKRVVRHGLKQQEAVERLVQNIPHDIQHIVVWGAGMHTEVLYHQTTLFHPARQKTFVIIDSDPIKRGTTWRGITCHSPCAMKDMDWSKAYLVISSYGSSRSIEKEAIRLGVPKAKIIHLYDKILVY